MKKKLESVVIILVALVLSVGTFFYLINEINTIKTTKARFEAGEIVKLDALITDWQRNTFSDKLHNTDVTYKYNGKEYSATVKRVVPKGTGDLIPIYIEKNDPEVIIPNRLVEDGPIWYYFGLGGMVVVFIFVIVGIVISAKEKKKKELLS